MKNEDTIMDLEAIFPAKERMELAMTLNNVLASPRFASWMQGWASAGLVVVAVFATAFFFVGRERCESQVEACRAAEH